MTRTNKKKVTATILLAVMMLLLLSVNIAEGTGINITVPTVNYHVGDTINATVSLSATSRWIKAWEMKLVFSKTKLTANTVIEGNFFKPPYQTFFSSGSINNSLGNIKDLYDVAIGGNVTAVRPILYVLFTAKTYGQVYINSSNVGVTNETMYLPGLTFTNASFYIYSPYDMNADKVIGMPDLIVIAGRYMQTGAPGWIKEDVDRNGIISIFDLICTILHWGPY